MSVEVRIERITSSDLVDGLNRLLPQLSNSAEPITLVSLSQMLSSDAVTLFAARLDGRIIGTLTLVIFPIPSGRRAWIEDVVVDQKSRGNGVGDALTRAAIEHARTVQVRSVDLTSRPTREAANALYVKLGFQRRETNVYRLSL